MSSDIAIRVEKLGKRYRIGGRREPYNTLRDTLTRAAALPADVFRAMVRSGRSATSRRDRQIWALKDLSFEVKRGEVVGVIGRNGAGKSTLLKVLSRITEPTAGWAEIGGRVGSLLEVGTGFHPELTGRENIFLNGAILGMRRGEIARRFDEIVAFAEVETFIDTPIKHYSSGMSLRLAFSVAAHLDPEILLIDEVLAVGDLAFQKKCMGRMEDVASQGRTVVFVSHNLAAIKELCQTSIVLKDGKLDFRGPAVQGVVRYSQDLMPADGEARAAYRGTGWRRTLINDGDGGAPARVSGGEPFAAIALFEVHDRFVHGRLKCRIDDASGSPILYQTIDTRDLGNGELNAGVYHLRVEIPPLWLAAGVYTLFFQFTGQRPSGPEERYTSERILIDVPGAYDRVGRGVLFPPLRWSLRRNAHAEGD